MRQLLILGFFVASACTVGDVTQRSPTADGGTGGPDGDLGSPDSGESQAACEPAALNLPNGEHNPGQACLSCHGPGGEGPRFSVAGTLYSSAAGAAVVPAATIVVTDANGLTFKLVTASNGNFYSSATIALPVTVAASKCPDTRAMIATAAGDCNSCHTVAGDGRVHLP